MAASIVTAKGQVTMPKSIRNALGVGPGDRVRFVLQESGVVVVVKPETIDVRSLRGLFAGRAPRPISIEEMNPATSAATSETSGTPDAKG